MEKRLLSTLQNGKIMLYSVNALRLGLTEESLRHGGKEEDDASMNLPIESWLQHLRRTLNAVSARLELLSNRCLLSYLLLFYFVVRLVTLEFVERSGDAIYKWGFIRCFLATGVWYPAAPDHHQGRWGINLPEMFFAWIFGPDSLIGYYVYPVLCGAAGAALAYGIVTRLRSKSAGCAVFLLFTFLPQIWRESCQFLPMLPAAVWMLGALWCLIRYCETDKVRFVFWSALLVFISYGCKFTSLYWAGAIGLFLLFQPKFSFSKAVWVFGLTLLAGLLIETLLLNHFFDVSYGRVQIITGSHLNDRPAPQYLGIGGYLLSFLRPLDLSGKYMDSFPKTIIMLAALPIAWGILRSKVKPLAEKMLAWSFLGAWIFQCYVVYKVFPFLHPERPHARYFLVIYAAAAIILCLGWSDAMAWCRARMRAPWQLLVPVVGTAFLLVLLTINFFNTMSNDGTTWNICQAAKWMDLAQQQHMPVLLQMDAKLKPNGTPENSDQRNYRLWTTLYAPADEIPGIMNLMPLPPEKLYSSGKKEFRPLFFSRNLPLDREMEVLIIDEFRVFHQKRSFTKESTPRLPLAFEPASEVTK